MSRLPEYLRFLGFTIFVSIGLFLRPVFATEVWVAPTSQQDLGGLEVASNAFWPVTPLGAARLVFGVPADLQTFQTAKILLIPNAPGGASTLFLFACQAQNG